MEIYRYFPAVERSFATATITSVNKQNRAKTQNDIGIRIDVFKLAILTAADATVHTLTAIGKTAAAVIQLPLYPLWEGTAPDLAFVEAGSHAARAIKSIFAATVVPIPALFKPRLATSAYTWLDLDEAQKDGFLARIAHRMKHAMSHLMTHQNLVRTASTTVIAVAALLSYKYLYLVDAPAPRSWMPWIFGIVGMGVVVAVCAQRRVCCTKVKIEEGEKRVKGDPAGGNCCKKVTKAVRNAPWNTMKCVRKCWKNPRKRFRLMAPTMPNMPRPRCPNFSMPGWPLGNRVNAEQTIPKVEVDQEETTTVLDSPIPV